MLWSGWSRGSCRAFLLELFLGLELVDVLPLILVIKQATYAGETEICTFLEHL